MNPSAENWIELLRQDVTLVLPECILIVGMCLVILVPFIRRKDSMLPSLVTGLTLLLSLVALLVVMPHGSRAEGGEMVEYSSVFHGMLWIDPFSQMFKMLLLIFTLLVVLQWLITRDDDVSDLDVPDFFCLLLGATTGMALMASANNLLMILVATETASLPSFALAGFRKRHKSGTESALKYVLFGSVSSAVMIYGMSLIYGCTGSLTLIDISEHVTAVGSFSPLMTIGIAAMLGGIAFKLSAVPMHFWCPDVFQGAPIPITTFLSVASKGAALAMFMRVLIAFHGSPAMGASAIAVGVAVLGAITATWGNLMAIQQTHLRRLLAFSSIAHAGYMIMGASVIVYLGGGGGAARPVTAAILFYLLVYMFMNLGAFTVGAIIKNKCNTEDIRDYAELRKRAPLQAALLTVFLLSLFGMPGLGGFTGKIYLAAAMVQLGTGGMVLVAILLLNTLISLYYYIRPVYFMYLVPDDADRPSFRSSGAARSLLVMCAVVLFWTGLLPNVFINAIEPFHTIGRADDNRPLPIQLQHKPGPVAAAPAQQEILP